MSLHSKKKRPKVRRKRPLTPKQKKLAAAVRHFEKFVHSVVAEEVAVAAKALRVQAELLEQDEHEHGPDPLRLAEWLRHLNRLIGLMCEPVALKHVIAVERDCGIDGCPGTHSYVLGFAPNQELQRMLRAAFETTSPDEPAVNVITPAGGAPN